MGLWVRKKKYWEIPRTPALPWVSIWSPQRIRDLFCHLNPFFFQWTPAYSFHSSFSSFFLTLVLSLVIHLYRSHQRPPPLPLKLAKLVADSSLIDQKWQNLCRGGLWYSARESAEANGLLPQQPNPSPSIGVQLTWLHGSSREEPAKSKLLSVQRYRKHDLL